MKFMGMVGGGSYPCTQVAPDPPKPAAPPRARRHKPGAVAVRRTPTPVRCVETGEVYASAAAAAAACGAWTSSIFRSCREGVRTKGLRFEYATADGRIVNEPHTRLVKCVETGRVYVSAREAADEIGGGVTAHGIRHACCSGQRHLGSHWAYVEDAG